jgi:hypothetical protein
MSLSPTSCFFLLLRSKCSSRQSVPRYKWQLNPVNIFTWINIGMTWTIRNIISLDSSVCIATGYPLDILVSILDSVRDFSILHSVHSGSGAPTAFYLVGTRNSSSGDKSAGAWSLLNTYPTSARSTSPGVKRTGHATYHSPPSIAEVKNVGFIPSLPHTSSCRVD